MIDDAIKKFLVALHAAEYAGASTNIDKIGFQDVETPLSVFKLCKARYLVMGDPSAAWITTMGKQLIGVK